MIKSAKTVANIAAKSFKRRVPWLLGLFVLALLVFLLLLQSSNLWKSFSADTASDTLLLYALSSLNFAALIVFGFIFLRSIVKLVRERRAFQLGSKIKTKLLVYFFAVSLMPIIAMAVFSYLFMNRALEKWFSNIPENVIQGAREVQRQSLIDRWAALDESARMVATLIDHEKIDEADLSEIARSGNLSHIEVLGPDNKTLVTFEREVPVAQRTELNDLLAAVRSGNMGEPQLRDGRGFDVSVVDMSHGRKLVIVPDPFGERAVSDIVENSLSEFERLKQKQVTVRQVGFLTLGMLTFLLIFASSWVAFHIARGLTLPIKALAEGADEIAKGNYGSRVDVLAEDELATLVETFNQMSNRLEANAAELNERQRYIETVIETLPNGVISFDADNRISTINRAAVNILKLEDGDFTGVGLDKLVSEENNVVIARLLARARRVGHSSEHVVLAKENSQGGTGVMPGLSVGLTAASLPDGDGVVLVIEDLSELIAAQRASAWQEVARRMAHEIKNPLTPIQLSAERIAKRCGLPDIAVEKIRIGSNMVPGSPISVAALSEANPESARIVKEGTDTILREVQSLKTMVDEFSRFARLPDIKLEPGELNELIEQVVVMYEDRTGDFRIETQLAPNLPELMIDAEQLKRTFVNLIENSIEAFDPNEQDRSIRIGTRFDEARELVVIELSDNGRGIDLADLQKLFQPYFSTKGRGTGLGLAIVQRIISEHKGKIKVVSLQPNGARFIIELPVRN